jgi:hypothetical protein
MAGKNSYFETAQNGLAEKLKPMLKNRHLTSACSKRLFREESGVLWLLLTFKATKPLFQALKRVGIVLLAEFRHEC